MENEVHPYQLLCFENRDVDVQPCYCHDVRFLDPGFSLNTNVISDLNHRIVDRLAHDQRIFGVYFVALWALPAFYSLVPIHISLNSNAWLPGGTLFINDLNRVQFLSCIASLSEHGSLPCHFLRKLDPTSNPVLLQLIPEEWFIEIEEEVSAWQFSM